LMIELWGIPLGRFSGSSSLERVLDEQFAFDGLAGPV